MSDEDAAGNRLCLHFPLQRFTVSEVHLLKEISQIFFCQEILTNQQRGGAKRNTDRIIWSLILVFLLNSANSAVCSFKWNSKGQDALIEEISGLDGDLPGSIKVSLKNISLIGLKWGKQIIPPALNTLLSAWCCRTLLLSDSANSLQRYRIFNGLEIRKRQQI